MYNLCSLAVAQRGVEATDHLYTGPVSNMLFISTAVIDLITDKSCFYGNNGNHTKGFQMQCPEMVIVVRTVLLGN